MAIKAGLDTYRYGKAVDYLGGREALFTGRQCPVGIPLC